MEEKLLLVQFTHPGGEHKSDKGKKYKSWNYGRHQRKFLKAEGDYISENKLIENKTLLFWGEWEPYSETDEILVKNEGDYPHYIHRPVFDKKQKMPPYVFEKKRGQKAIVKTRQNTDPYVFGDQFHYCCCKQWKKGKPTQLAKLAQESIVLFGSTINQKNKNESYFALDTVFVVGSFIEYNAENFDSKLKGKVSDDYFEISIKSAYSKHLEKQIPNNNTPEVRCYFGATYQNKVNGMYSFVPCKRYENNAEGYERVKIFNKDLNFITNNLNAAPKLNKVRDIKSCWNKIRDIIKEQGFFEGVKFDYYTHTSGVG